MRIALDVMGGDNAPDAILAGGLGAAELLADDDELVLIGDEAIIRDGLKEEGLHNDKRFLVEPTTQVIGMDESPVSALREKDDSSIVKMAWLGSKKKAGDRYCDIIISAGNTGACVAAAQMSMRRLPGVHRPGIAIVLPTFHGPVVLCDVGANPEPKPGHLYQYAVMAGVYAEKVLGIDDPKVGVMNIGGEEGKGTPMVRETNALCRADEKLNYAGYVEGRDLFNGKASVVVTEGFTGNVVLKLSEGLSKGIFQTITREAMEIDIDLAMRFEPVVKSIYKKHDYHEFGGAPLLGANGICMICHGSSESRTITNAIRKAKEHAASGVNEAIIEALAEHEGRAVHSGGGASVGKGKES
ncbi:MAG: phosphate acyltransferase PlsX [Planctomycetota bacterium]